MVTQQQQLVYACHHRTVEVAELHFGLTLVLTRCLGGVHDAAVVCCAGGAGALSCSTLRAQEQALRVVGEQIALCVYVCDDTTVRERGAAAGRECGESMRSADGQVEPRQVF